MAKNEFKVALPIDGMELTDELIDRIKNQIMRTVSEEILKDKFSQEGDSVGVSVGPVSWSKEYN